MNDAHWHLLLNHIPIVGVFFSACLLLAGLALKNRSIQHAGAAALVVVALMTIPAFLTGEPAEEVVEKIRGVAQSAIEAHEERAETALWLVEATGLCALAWLALVWRKKAVPPFMKALTPLLAAVSFAVLLTVGNEGGRIRHSEIRGDVTVPWIAPPTPDDDGHEADDD